MSHGLLASRYRLLSLSCFFFSQSRRDSTTSSGFRWMLLLRLLLVNEEVFYMIDGLNVRFLESSASCYPANFSRRLSSFASRYLKVLYVRK